mmetsp:Transcript_23497/g.79365  ORF Transcript_23497/g.79365 Transcript_23497/m.79365 type:complete len:216 (-) Transcript_23497:706-1353(-)
MTPRCTASRARASMRPRRARETDVRTMMSMISLAAAAEAAPSGSRRQASRAAPKAASAGAMSRRACALSSSTAAAELFARAAPLMAVPKVTSVGMMRFDSSAVRRSSISAKRPLTANEFRAMLYETTLSETLFEAISPRIAVVALPISADCAACSRALYVARGMSQESAFMRRHRSIAVLPFDGLALPHAVIAAWYSGVDRRSLGSAERMAKGVR